FFQYAVQSQQALAAVGQFAAGVTTVGTGGHTEGSVTGGAVHNRRQNVHRQAALAFEQHVTPATARATRGFSVCTSNRTQQYGSNDGLLHRDSPDLNVFLLPCDRHVARPTASIIDQLAGRIAS